MLFRSTKALEEKDVKIATLMNKLELQDSGESSLGPEHPPGFTLKGKRRSRHFSTQTFHLNGLDICPTTTRHDNEHHSSTIRRFFYKFSYIFKTLHKAH